ncbi:hypothetical protein GCM10012275_29250 [Longimycelium tulufanense]|uniref:Ricin B lectin domain-containing protein n=1 Tax=Longimycelium tulufanense TaxID=907463 RepID=A0A8J3CBW1_9PSEU|nr:hypothetical protein [Longimycelium tulufanense]GGM56308.1 hypothetical protein GCM10012275_29250 [Longimycelium tulufanense]
MEKSTSLARKGLVFTFLFGAAALLPTTGATAAESGPEGASAGTGVGAGVQDRQQCSPQGDILTSAKPWTDPADGQQHHLVTEIGPDGKANLAKFGGGQHQQMDICVNPEDSRTAFLKPRNVGDRSMCYGVPGKNLADNTPLSQVPCGSSNDSAEIALFDKSPNGNDVVLKVVHRQPDGSVHFKCVAPAGGNVSPQQQIVQVSCGAIDTSAPQNRWILVGLPKAG